VRVVYLTDPERRCVLHRSETPLFPAQPRFRDLINKLVATTDGMIIAHSRKIAASSEAQRAQPRMSLVPLVWSVSQRVSRDINILTAIERVTSFLLMNLLSLAVRQSWTKR
jgi:hypothetical protein